MHTQFDREEEALINDYNAGHITMAEFNKQMAELRRDYRAAAEESSQDAYDREMSNW